MTYVDGPFDARVIFGSGVDDAVRRIVASLPDAVLIGEERFRYRKFFE